MQMMCTDKIKAFEYWRFWAMRYVARAQLISQKQLARQLTRWAIRSVRSFAAMNEVVKLGFF